MSRSVRAGIRARGNARKRVALGCARLTLASLAALVLALSFGVSPAGATKAPKFDFGSFGTQGGQLSSTRGVAINQTGNGGVPAGTLYVADFGNNRVQEFSANGNFIRTWGQDVDSTGGAGFEICEVAVNCKAGVPGGAAGQFNGIAGGIAVDQATGNVYINDRGNNRVQEFSANGNFIRTWGQDVDSTGGAGFEICEVAVNCKAGVAGSGAGMFAFAGFGAIVGIGTDSSGNVYVADAGNNRVQKFSPAGAFLSMGGWDVTLDGSASDPTSFQGYQVCTVAADCKAGAAGGGAGQFDSASNLPSFLATAPTGDVYVVGRSNGTIYHLSSALAFDPAFAPASVPGSASNRNALAVNSADGHIFFAKSGDTNIYELNPVTQELVEPPTPAGTSGWVGLAVNATSGRMYATQSEGSFVRVFDDPQRPTVEADPATANSGTKATLNGTVNPEGLAITECKFEYGKTTAYGQSVPCAETPAEIGAGNSPVAVHADISGLTPNATTYNFRLVATNSERTSESQNEDFETAETVITQAATAITATTATLNGTVNPDGVAITECKFEYGKTTAYGQSVPCAETPGSLGTGTSPVAVHADIGGLDPNATTYNFRLVATYAAGIGAVNGKNLSFFTKGPVIVETWAEDVSLTEATLQAKINPKGAATTYRFEYGTSEAYGQQTPELAVGSDNANHDVAAFIAGLEPDTTYHYRAVATNSDAVNLGPDRTFTTYESPSAKAGCLNEEFRVGPAADLPDCRAYEMVSPSDKGGGDIVAKAGPVGEIEAAFRESAADGNKITYTSTTAFGDALRGSVANQYISSRDDEEGWSTHGLNPPQGTTVFDPGPSDNYDLDTNFMAFSKDLCAALVRDHNLVPLTSEGLANHTNLYLRDNCEPGADSYQALTKALTLPTDKNLALNYGSFSGDGSHIVFGAAAALGSTPPAAATENQQIYNFSGGQLHLVSILPGGEASDVNSAVGLAYAGVGHSRGSSPLERAVSEDGSRIFWTSDGKIYVRVDNAQTLQVASSGEFVTAAADGSTAIYSQGGSLFKFDVDKALASEAATSLIAGEAGGVVGSSEDLSYLYFTSEEALAPGATAGEWNVYLRRGGEPIFVAAVSLEDHSDGAGIDRLVPGEHSSRVTPDGRHLAFMSDRNLTGYDNTDANTGEAASEVYRYDADTEQLICVSCNPGGGRPVGRKARTPYRLDRDSKLHAAAWLPTWEWSTHGRRSLSEDGSRIFFNSYDALALQDTNGAQDVYQWEALGAGSCDAEDATYSEQNGGCISLISTGEDPEESMFIDASSDGRDAFFTTAASIDARDRGSIDLYDARSEGGFPPPPPPLPPCIGDACQSVPSPPATETPASAIFRGPPDPKAKPKPRCRKGKVRRKGRCVARKQHKHRGQRHEGRAGR